jgi:hypothetical protein
MNKHIAFSLLILLLLTACGPQVTPSATSTPASTASATPIPATATGTPTLEPTLTATLTPTQTSTPSPTDTSTPSPTSTSTVTPIPTYVKLRGKVIIDQAVCHYGPGAPYLYKYGVYKGSNLEIIARAEPGEYIQIQAIGGDNPCWVNPKYMEIKGDLNNVRPIDPIDAGLPMSPYYAPPTRYSAARDGSKVTVFWSALPLRAGDDSEQTPYIVEAWVCKDGDIIFHPYGTYQLAVEVEDEPGCAAPSHARLIAAEKHGYTRPVEIPWPQPEQ